MPNLGLGQIYSLIITKAKLYKEKKRFYYKSASARIKELIRKNLEILRCACYSVDISDAHDI